MYKADRHFFPRSVDFLLTFDFLLEILAYLLNTTMTWKHTQPPIASPPEQQYFAHMRSTVILNSASLSNPYITSASLTQWNKHAPHRLSAPNGLTSTS
jgi:hypothetical protein